MQKTVVLYITGCLGFMGSYVTRLCLDEGWYVRGIDKCTYASNSLWLEEFKQYPNFTFERIDINDIPFLYDCDYIINMAAETHVANSIVHSEEFLHSNVNGVHHLLELIKNSRQEITPILLHFSTDEVYGDIVEGKHTEKDLLKPSNPYSATKAAGDMLILAWNRTYGVPYIIVRPTNNYGIGQYTEKFIPKACKYLLLGRQVPLHNNGTPIRNWLHASDTASAILAIIQSGKFNEIYNIAGNGEKQNIVVFQKILDILQFPGKIEEYILHHERPGQDVRYALDDTKLKELGWQPMANFDEELVKIVQWYRQRFIW